MAVEIVIIDDSQVNLNVFTRILQDKDLELPEKIHIQTFKDPKEALSHIYQNGADIVITDFFMPEITGLEILKEIKSHPDLKDILVVIITSFDKEEVMAECLKNGASDFIIKPIRKLEFIPKIRNLSLLAMDRKLLKNNILLLKKEVEKATKIIKEREWEIIHRLAVAAEYRDVETGKHIQRVSQYSLLLAKKIGLDEHYQELIEKASPLHDIGKIAISDSILLKPDKLTDKEFVNMRNHTLYGYKILYDPNIELLKIASEIALYHHEKWNGKGYPYGKKGEEIPLHARITTVADVFDAWTSRRKYKEPWPLEKAFLELEKEKGESFDPHLVDIFIASKKEVETIYHNLKDSISLDEEID